MTATKVKGQNIDLNDLFAHNYALGETITAAGPVALMPDGKLYKINGNKRTMTGAVTGQTATKSCLFNGGAKIATLGRTGSNLTLFIGTINYATNTITYGTGVQVTTNNADGSYFVTTGGTDSIVVTYGTSGLAYHNYGYFCARAITVSGTVPTIGSENQIYSDGIYGATAQGGGCYVAPGKVALGYYIQYNGSTACGVLVCGISGTVLTTGGGVGAGGIGGGIVEVQYVADDIFAYTFSTGNSSTGGIMLVSVVGTTPTGGSNIQTGTTSYNPFMGTDGTYIYCLFYTSNGAHWNLRKYSYSGNTLTQIFVTGDVTPGYIFLNGNMVGLQTGTTIVRYTQGSAGITIRNTIDYGITLTQQLGSYSSNYNMVAYTTDPSTVYRVGNEDRNIIGFLPTPGNYGDTYGISIDGEIITTTIAPSTTPTTEATGMTYISTNSTTPARGFRILAKATVPLVSVTKSGTCTATTAYIKSDVGNTILATATFVGNVATFNYNITNGTYYRIEVDSGGSAYTEHYKSNGGYPVVGTNINYIESSAVGADYTFGNYNIESIITTSVVAGANLVPGAVYYLSTAGAIDSNGAQKFGRAIGTTSMLLDINVS